MLGVALSAAVILANPAAAQDTAPDSNGISAYSVARLKIFEGSVWVRTPDSGDWEEYIHNSPLAERSRISVPEGSEAEVQFHGGQFVLLTGGTEMDIREMRENKTDFLLRSGEIRFYLPDSDFSPVHLLAPNEGKIDFPVPGQYWVTAGEGSDTRLVVRSGEATIHGKGREFPVNAGEEASIGRGIRVGKYSGDDSGGYEAPPPLTAEEENAKIPPAAAYELREYGEWVSTPEYGTVWRPRVAKGWSPYYYGRWEWVSPYGWTWIAYEPWGWYPYHYGYWYNHHSFGWVWYPFHSFISFSFALGHHHGHYNVHHYHRNAHYYSSNARFHHDGRSVRWVPLRPGERHTRARFTRADKRIARWNRPLERGRVFIRRGGERGREWRDFTVVQRERQRVRESRTETRRSDGGKGVQGRNARQERGEVRARSTETRRLERGRVPQVRTESRSRRTERKIWTRESRPGGTGRSESPGIRNERPSRGGGGNRSRGGRGGSFNRIERGDERVMRYGRSGSSAGTVSESNRSAGGGSRTGGTSRGRAIESKQTVRSGSSSVKRSRARSGSVSRPSGADRGSANIRRTGGRSESSSGNRSGARSGSVSRPSGENRGSANIRRTSGRSGSGSVTRSVGRSGSSSVTRSVGRSGSSSVTRSVGRSGGGSFGRSGGFGRGGSFGRGGGGRGRR
jgi:hypothetical protein